MEGAKLVSTPMVSDSAAPGDNSSTIVDATGYRRLIGLL